MVLPSHQENQSLGSCSLSQKDLMNPTASTPTIPTFRHGRLLATIAFVLVAALLCSVTVRHLAADNTASPLEAQEGHPVQQSPSPSIGAQLDAIRAQLAGLTEALQDLEQKASQAVDQQVLPKDMPQLRQRLLARRQMAWQPMKRMVSWQPVKRQMQMADPYYADETTLQGGESAKEKVMFMVEQQLQQVLAAGERLGVSANEILLHLRTRNG